MTGLTARDAAVALGLLAVAGWLCVEGQAGNAHEALPDIVRGGAATIAFLGLTGYAAAQLLTPRDMLPHLLLLVLPLGAVCGSLALTLLGSLHVPFDLSLALVMACALGAAVAVRQRVGPRRPDTGDTERAGGNARRLLYPFFVVALLAGLTLMPSLRVGALTVPGNDPDAHLVTGAAEVVSHGPPTSVQPQLPVDRVSPYWRSKYPIYYSLAAVSRLSGLDPAKAFPLLAGAVFASLVLGVFLLAFYILRAGPVISLLAAGFVGLDRVVLYVETHPYYNQLWGTFALPFMLLFGLRFLRRPDRRSAVLTLLFLAIGVFAYPLMLPFPAVVLGVAAVLIWRHKRAAGEPVEWISALRLPDVRARLRRWRWALILAAIPVGLVVLGLGAAVIDKGVHAAAVILPGGDLDGWQGDSPNVPIAHYFGLPAVTGLSVLLLAGLAVAGYHALRRVGRDERIALVVMAVAAGLMGLYFHNRRFGEYFEFKTLAFLGPVVLACGVVGTAQLVTAAAGSRRRFGTAAVAILGVALLGGARNELKRVSAQTPPEAFELRSWARSLPPDASVLIAIPPSGIQLWASYMMHERPQSSPVPVVRTTYPHVRRGFKADYVLIASEQFVGIEQPRPLAAVGPPVRRNAGYRLYRLDPRLPGRDRSSRARIQPSG